MHTLGRNATLRKRSSGASAFDAVALQLCNEAREAASFTDKKNTFKSRVIASHNTSRTFLAQNKRANIYGLCSTARPGFQVKTGRLHVGLSRESR